VRPLTVIVMIHNGLGDVVTTLPLLERLDRQLPADGRLVLVAKSPLEERFIRLFPWRHAPEIFIIGPDRSLRGILHILRVGWSLRRRKAHIFIAGVMPDSLVGSLFSLLVAAKTGIGQEGKWRRLGFPVGHAWPEGEHKVSYYARFAEAANLVGEGAPIIFPSPRFPSTANSTAQVRSKLLLLAPGSGPSETHKRWPARSYGQLARRLLEQIPDVRIGIFGGAQERSLLQRVADEVGPSSRCEILAPEAIEESLQILQNADCVVSGCSGSLHLAALLDRPIVGLYGPTNPSITGPYSNKTIIVRLGLACSPCYHPWFTKGCGTPICMTELDVERVQAAVCAALEGRTGPFPRTIRSTQATAPSPQSRVS
jgi:heptosyltransferase-2